VHEQYRNYQHSSKDMEERVQQYRSDWQRALDGERGAKKETMGLRLENDELVERINYLEQKYQGLATQVNASQEDLQAVEEAMLYGEPDEQALRVDTSNGKRKGARPQSSKKRPANEYL